MRSLYRSQFTRADSGLRDIVYSTEAREAILDSNPAVHQHAAHKRHSRILRAILQIQKSLNLQ